MDFLEYLKSQPKTPLMDAVMDAFRTMFSRPRPLVVASDKDHLKQLIDQEIKEHGRYCSLNHIDVSNIQDMSGLFQYSDFNGNISKWDVSDVTNMNSMFQDSKFNGDISMWDVSNVTDMGWMFAGSAFNGDISNWDVSNVTNMRFMFSASDFSGDISNWIPSIVKNKISMWSLEYPKLLQLRQKIDRTLKKIDIDSITEAAGARPRKRVVARDKDHLEQLIRAEIIARLITSTCPT